MLDPEVPEPLRDSFSSLPRISTREFAYFCRSFSSPTSLNVEPEPAAYWPDCDCPLAVMPALVAVELCVPAVWPADEPVVEPAPYLLVSVAPPLNAALVSIQLPDALL